MRMMKIKKGHLGKMKVLDIFGSNTGSLKNRQLRWGREWPFPLSACQIRTNAFKLRWGKYKLDIRKIFPARRIMKHWSRDSRIVFETPLEKFLRVIWANVYQEWHKNSSSNLRVEEWLNGSFSYFLFLFPVIPSLSSYLTVCVFHQLR